MSPDPIARLCLELGKLPGIGQKTAARLALYLLRKPPEVAYALADALREARSQIRFCSVCQTLTAEDPCAICRDARRNPALVCVVAHPQDLMAVEQSGFRGRYHVLHGVLSPLDGIGPEELRIRELLARLAPAAADSPGGDRIAEVIVATSPNVEGEATALYLARTLKPLGIKVTRIASGVPMGGDLEFVDKETLLRALDGRREM